LPLPGLATAGALRLRAVGPPAAARTPAGSAGPGDAGAKSPTRGACLAVRTPV